MRKCTDAIVGAAVEIYSRMSTDLLPTPAKSHYVFNLRDLSKCVQGMCDSVINHCFFDVIFRSCLYVFMTYFLGVLQADPGIIRDSKKIFRLFCHESLRVFHDRLINHEDKNYYYGMLSEMANKHFGEVCF